MWPSLICQIHLALRRRLNTSVKNFSNISEGVNLLLFFFVRAILLKLKVISTVLDFQTGGLLLKSNLVLHV